MSRKGNCWDNACVESFFHSMKVEAVQYESMMHSVNLPQRFYMMKDNMLSVNDEIKQNDG